MGSGGMSCGMKFARLIMVLVNLLFLLIGMALIGIGVWIFVDPSFKKIREFLPIDSNPGIERGISYLEVAAIVVLVIGSVLAIFGFLGCCGAMKQVKCLLTIYASIVVAIMLVEIAITIYFFAFRSKFDDQLIPKLQETITNNYEGPLGLIESLKRPKPSSISLAWDFIMFNYKCCGVNNFTDFRTSTKWDRTNPWTNRTNFTVPLTCCPIPGADGKNWNDLPLDKLNSSATCAENGGANVYQQGCYSKIFEIVDNSKKWIILGIVLVLVIELLAFSIAIGLCCRGKSRQSNY